MDKKRLPDLADEPLEQGGAAVANSLGMTMLPVPGGSFIMGDTADGDPDWQDSDEKPLHTVSLAGFFMSATPITQAQYARVMDSNPSHFRHPDKPVECVSWFDAVEFCNRLSAAEGLPPAYRIAGTAVALDPAAKGYRLPTEAEWEYAAKGGESPDACLNHYAGSNYIDDVAWFNASSAYLDQASPDHGTHVVGKKQPNTLGLYDMSGNVFEWCWDWYGCYSEGDQTQPLGPESGTWRILRGGSWNYNEWNARVSARSFNQPAESGNHIGFRVVAGF